MAHIIQPFWRPFNSSQWGRTPQASGQRPKFQSPMVGENAMASASVKRAARTTSLRVESKAMTLFIRRYMPLQNPVCPILGKRRHKVYRLSKGIIPRRIDYHTFPHISTYKLWWEKGQRQVFIKCSNKGYKTIMLKGIDEVCQRRRIDLNKLDFIDWSPEAIAFRKRYSGDYLPYNMVYGPPFNRKLKDPKKVAEAETLLVRKWVSNRIVEARISREEAVREGVMPDVCYQHLPEDLKRLFNDQKRKWEENLPEPPIFVGNQVLPEAEEYDEEEDGEGDEIDQSNITRGM